MTYITDDRLDYSLETQLNHCVEQLETELHDLRRQAAHHKTVIDALPGYIAWKDMSGNYIDHNAMCSTLMEHTGLTEKLNRTHLSGLDSHAIFSEQTADEVVSLDETVLNKNVAFLHNAPVTFTTDVTRTCLTYRTPMHDASGDPTGTLGNTIDYTNLLKKSSTDLWE